MIVAVKRQAVEKAEGSEIAGRIVGKFPVLHH
jgi:hypothetical protein